MGVTLTFGSGGCRTYGLGTGTCNLPPSGWRGVVSCYEFLFQLCFQLGLDYGCFLDVFCTQSFSFCLHGDFLRFLSLDFLGQSLWAWLVRSPRVSLGLAVLGTELHVGHRCLACHGEGRGWGKSEGDT